MLMQAAEGKIISKVGADGVWLCGVLPSEKYPTGLAIALPLLLVFGGLFVAADAVFAGWVGLAVDEQYFGTALREQPGALKAREAGADDGDVEE